MAFLIVNETKRARISAQKAIHTYPNVSDGWAVLSSALQKFNDAKQLDGLILKITQVTEKLEPSKFMTDWIQKQFAVMKS